MNENENNFEQVRQLLKLKRQETPPPGYFNKFSGQVIARLRVNQEKGIKTDAEAYFADAPWLLKFLQLFEFKPAFAGALASALCLLLVFGIIYGDRPEITSQPVLQNAPEAPVAFAAVAPVVTASSADTSGLIASTNPAASLQPVAALFDSQNPFAQQVSFSPDGK